MTTKATPSTQEVQEIIDLLNDLLRRGFLTDSPDFIQEKQTDGRYLIKLRQNALKK